MPERIKIYTKKGDRGKTTLYGGKKVWKDNLRVSTYGDIDELVSSIGVIISLIKNGKEKNNLQRIQEDLFLIGSLLANPILPSKGKVLENRTKEIENWIDEMEKRLSPLRNFILPRGPFLSSYLHLTRAICRRAERSLVALGQKEKIEPQIIPYINRLSDLLFILARWINKRQGYKEQIWSNKIIQ